MTTLSRLPGLLGNELALNAVLGTSHSVITVAEPARAISVAALTELSDRHPFLVAVPTTGEAERLVSDLREYLGSDGVELFPAWETLPFERISPSVEAMGRRLRAVWRLRSPEERGARVVVAPIRALVQRLGPHVEDVEPIIVRPGDQLDTTSLVADLVNAGYVREYQVEHRGELAVRGSIVDVFPSTADVAVRIDLWGDEVDRLSTISVNDQRSRIELSEVAIFPCRELLPSVEVREKAELLLKSQPWGADRWQRLVEGERFEGMESWLPWLVDGERLLVDLLPSDAQVILVDPRRMRDRAGDLMAEEADLASALGRTWGVTEVDDMPRLHLGFDRLLAHTKAPAWTITSVPEGPEVPLLQTQSLDTTGSGERLIAQLEGLLKKRFRVVIAADGSGSASRISQSLRDAGLGVSHYEPGSFPDLSVPGIHVVVAPIERGVIIPSAHLAIVAEHDVTGRRRSHRGPRTRPKRETAGFFDALQVGDHVVHAHHGVARYGGMVKRNIGGVDRDYLLLEYRGDDKLYVPSDQIDAVRPYTGSDSPSLHRLSGSEWQKVSSRARAEAKKIAQELVVLYQKRVHSPGHAFSPDTPWQREMEEEFPYQETPDQLAAIAEVKSDMESPMPMDRLICGDVGFGKTEVALRAVFKAVQDGKQAAVLVPTTLLAQQHGQTFADRFASYPVRVEVLSRFLTSSQARKVVEGAADGSIDVVIGTHRLLSADISFKNLGLLVIDEEQRFGVAHKEVIKHLKADVDVLTLSATPIPRTLEMSLTGIRDLSLLNTPPADRQPILTYVGEHDDRAIAEALRRELLREGQVFFVHNRVKDIEVVAGRLREMVPEARICVAHGQMDEGTLEQVVIDFWEGQYDVLVCTTIIESGIDMPTVNTLVVDRADLLGLGQLHQLRGRVGRAGSRAYAYLFHPRDQVLSDESYERLKTIGESTELGSGFRIAMRDLEIRGAGNLLGESQSGHIGAVGYDLYVQMVTEAVAELKGEPVREPAEVKLELPIDAFLPSDYVGREEQRLEAYRRLAIVTSLEEVSDIQAEWEDRYGPVPAVAAALLGVARLRAQCHRTGVKEVTVTPNRTAPGYLARLSPLVLRPSAAVRLRRLAQDARWLEESAQLVVPLRKSDDVAKVLGGLLDELVPPATESVAS